MSDEPESAPLVLRLIGRAVGLAILAVTAALVWRLTVISFAEPRTDDATVRADLIGVVPIVSGPMIALNVRDNQMVRTGDVLFEIDPIPYRAEVERTEAALALAQAEVASLNEAIAAAKAEVARLEAERAIAEDYFKRYKAALPGKGVSELQLADSDKRHRATIAAVQKAQAEQRKVESLLIRLGDADARVTLARANIVKARYNLDHTQFIAPFDGQVTNLNTAVGEYLHPGRAVFALIDNRRWYVIARYLESYLDPVAPGQPVDVRLITYADFPIAGKVDSIAWAVASPDGTGVLPSVPPSSNWVRIANRIPVRIGLPPPTPAKPYRMGMTATVTVKTDRLP